MQTNFRRYYNVAESGQQWGSMGKFFTRCRIQLKRLRVRLKRWTDRGKFEIDRAKSKNNIAENSFALGHETHNSIESGLKVYSFIWSYYLGCFPKADPKLGRRKPAAPVWFFRNLPAPRVVHELSLCVRLQCGRRVRHVYTVDYEYGELEKYQQAVYHRRLPTSNCLMKVMFVFLHTFENDKERQR